MSPALETRGLCRSFGGIEATRDVTLSLAAGARHALIGPNGAGKTTLINLLTGVLRPSAGSIVLDGADITALPAAARVRRGLARTFQINQLFAAMTPLETLVLAVTHRLGRQWGRLGGSHAAVEEAAALIERFRLSDVMGEAVGQLAYGRQRLLEIALAIACRPRVLLLDEPAAGVPEAERDDILESLAALPQSVGVLLIEHDMDLVFRFAERISVLVGGALLTEGTPDEIARDPRVREVYLGPPHMAELLAIEHLRSGHGAAVVIGDLSLTLEAGQSLAVLGRNGMGKTTLLDSIVGVTRRFSGSIRLDGREIASLAPERRAAAGIGWVPQERNIFRSLTVEENLTAIARPGPWSLTRAYALFPRLRERRGNLGGQLSGGEQQMLAIARALVLNPKLLLLDEPTEGLAPILVDEVLAALRRIMREEGLSALIVEQHARKILDVTDRAIVLERGSIVLEAPSAGLLAEPGRLERHLGVARGVRPAAAPTSSAPGRSGW